jgi:hypothetical protein
MTSRFEHVVKGIARERADQLERWGDNSHTPLEWLVIIFKQMGQASDAAIKIERNRYRHELTQAAACIIAALEDELTAAPVRRSVSDSITQMKTPFQLATEQLQTRIADLEGAVNYALIELGVDPSDWSDGKVGLEAAFACNKRILSGDITTRDDWGDVPEDSLTAAIFDFVGNSRAEAPVVTQPNAPTYNFLEIETTFLDATEVEDMLATTDVYERKTLAQWNDYFGTDVKPYPNRGRSYED